MKCYGDSKKGVSHSWGHKIGDRLRGVPKSKEHIAAAHTAKMQSKKYWDGRPRGKSHHAWKGDMVGYCAVHDWVSARVGKADRCESCGSCEPSKKYNLANLSGEYRRDLSDWKKMCVSCHRKYDITNGTWAKGKFNTSKSGGHSTRA
jgi:hypothetical protein